MRLRSTAFEHEHEIPARHTCEGEDVSPPLECSGVPDDAESLALIVDDPDAPDPRAPKTIWVHWVVYDLPPDASRIAEGGPLPGEAREGKNDWKRAQWNGPCPPVGRHRYYFKLYALDTTLGDLGRPTKAELEQAMKGHILAQTELIGTYEKKKV
jgi:Raf kinase inhibitor-like YbhB/YbcL family protein